MKKSKIIAYCLLFFSIVIIDRFTKYCIRAAHHNYKIYDFLTLTLQYNRGISWGMFHSEDTTLFWIITAIIALFIAFFFVYTVVRFLNKHIIIGEVMVCAGALSNFIDRILYGGVADFILISNGTWSFPVFNIADIFIVSGLSIILISGLLSDEN